jgi:Holliday junction DNA helicase RuvB
VFITDPRPQNEDKNLDKTLRPYNFEEYFGQEKIKRNLKVLLEAAKKRGEAVEHILLYGGSGLGKTTLAHIIAKELGTNLRITSGPAIEKVGDLASILTNLEKGDVLFIDECHRLNKLIEEYIYPAMEEFSLNIIIGKGPSARTIQLELPPFTLIAATTRISLLSSPLRNRFGATYHLDFYEEKDVENILNRSSRILKVGAEKEGLKEIAKRARRTPRVANRLLKRVRDYAQVNYEGKITKKISQEALAMLEIDDLGLEPVDRLIISTIIEKFNGGPVGIETIAAATSEEKDTISDIYEPYLMQLGFLARTPQGRVATHLAYKHLGLKSPKDIQKKLIE